MVLNEMSDDGSQQEDSRGPEPDVIAKGNILESFTESQETQDLINSLSLVHKDLKLQESTLEKFKGISFLF